MSNPGSLAGHDPLRAEVVGGNIMDFVQIFDVYHFLLPITFFSEAACLFFLLPVFLGMQGNSLILDNGDSSKTELPGLPSCTFREA